MAKARGFLWMNRMSLEDRREVEWEGRGSSVWRWGTGLVWLRQETSRQHPDPWGLRDMTSLPSSLHLF